MANEINLTISLPSKTYLSKKVSGVMIPAVRADITILPNRAPSVFMLEYGVLQILTKSGQPEERYYVKSGAVQVADDNCQVMAQYLLPYDKISTAEAKKRLDEAVEEEDKIFYQMIYDYQRGIRRHYLRTLNVFGDRSSMYKTHEENVVEIKDSLEELKKKLPKK